MDFSGLQLAMQKTQEQKEEEARKAANKPIGSLSPLKLNTAESIAEKNRQKKLQNMSKKAKERRAKAVERGEGYIDKLKMAEKTRLKDLRGKPRFKVEKPKKDKKPKEEKPGPGSLTK